MVASGSWLRQVNRSPGLRQSSWPAHAYKPLQTCPVHDVDDLSFAMQGSAPIMVASCSWLR